ncbi:hypothetical protein CISG_03429 [Coccidioides immitis RMSCC 3703]|uniref:Uncharacterized protein n=1 Tax=Coccidioides immitis RMSCC 3703 TaxID=454286 RepID=A0A0J8QPE5_COCIT|nr:hypothetical protein CISG_03429 [Coccidioides immitis RMSCC 3703]
MMSGENGITKELKRQFDGRSGLRPSVFSGKEPWIAFHGRERSDTIFNHRFTLPKVASRGSRGGRHEGSLGRMRKDTPRQRLTGTLGITRLRSEAPLSYAGLEKSMKRPIN